MTLMERVAALEEAVAELLSRPRPNEITPGTAIGDHRDAFRQMAELHCEAESIERHLKAAKRIKPV